MCISMEVAYVYLWKEQCTLKSYKNFYVKKKVITLETLWMNLKKCAKK